MARSLCLSTYFSPQLALCCLLLAIHSSVFAAEDTPEVEDLEAQLLQQMQAQFTLPDAVQDPKVTTNTTANTSAKPTNTSSANLSNASNDEPLEEEQLSPPEIKVKEVYTQDDLIQMINRNKHLYRIQSDNCQLVQDIEARANILGNPGYQFLWGDMLAWGICVKAQPKLGIHYMELAAKQGLAAAMQQLAQYYFDGSLVQVDRERAFILLREAAARGFLKAQLDLGELLVQGEGSPYDYEDAYRWLHHAVISNPSQYQQAQKLLAQLSTQMPKTVVERAKRSQHPY